MLTLKRRNPKRRLYLIEAQKYQICAGIVVSHHVKNHQ